jgi:hypothetical protein
VTFAFAADFSHDLTVNLRSISQDTLGSSPLFTESKPIFINSLFTPLWLPTEVCQRFEEVFNLTWTNPNTKSETNFLTSSSYYARVGSWRTH